MFKMLVADAITKLVQAWFPKPKGEGLLVILNLRLEVPGRQKEYAHTNLSFIFERPVHHGSCRVFSGTTDTGFDIPEINKFEMQSNHDSCWKDAVGTEISKQHLRIAMMANNRLPPDRMREWSDIHTIRPVTLEWEVDPIQAALRRDDYMKRLTKLELS